jgi:hypothetical protein
LRRSRVSSASDPPLLLLLRAVVDVSVRRRKPGEGDWDGNYLSCGMSLCGGGYVLENTKFLSTGVAFPVYYQHSLPRQQRVVSLSGERALSPSLSLSLSRSRSRSRLALALALALSRARARARALSPMDFSWERQLAQAFTQQHHQCPRTCPSRWPRTLSYGMRPCCSRWRAVPRVLEHLARPGK